MSNPWLEIIFKFLEAEFSVASWRHSVYCIEDENFMRNPQNGTVQCRMPEEAKALWNPGCSQTHLTEGTTLQSDNFTYFFPEKGGSLMADLWNPVRPSWHIICGMTPAWHSMAGMVPGARGPPLLARPRIATGNSVPVIACKYRHHSYHQQ